MEELGGYIIGAGHKAKIFKDWLNWMEDNVCRCRRTPSKVGEEFISLEEEARMELFYMSI